MRSKRFGHNWSTWAFMEIYNCNLKVTIILRRVALVMIRGVFGDSQKISAFWRGGIWLKIMTRLKHAKSFLSCLTLCDPMGCSLPASSVHEILQEIILKWVAISFSRGSSQPRDWTCVFLHWQADSLPLSHQGNPKWYLAFADSHSIHTQIWSPSVEVNKLLYSWLDFWSF